MNELEKFQNMSKKRWIVQHTINGIHPTILAVCREEESAKQYVSLMEKQDAELAQGLQIYLCFVEI